MPTLRVRVIEARNLWDKDGAGKSDPYAAISVGGRQVLKTKYINNSLNPVWNESFTVQVVDPLHESVRVEIFDHDRFTRDDTLGFAEAPLAHLPRQKESDLWLNLGGARNQGQVHIALFPEDFGVAQAAAAPAPYPGYATATAPPHQPGYSYAPQPGFPAPAPQPGFGYAPQPGYGAPAPQPGYGAPAPQPGYSYAPGHAAPPTAFPAPAPQPGYSYAPQPTPGYGAPAPQPGYGAPAPQPGYSYAPGSAAPMGFGGIDASRYATATPCRFSYATITFHNTQTDTYSLRYDSGAEVHNIEYWRIYLPTLTPPNPDILVDGARVLVKTRHGDFLKGTVNGKRTKPKKPKKMKPKKMMKAAMYGGPIMQPGMIMPTRKIKIRSDKGRKLKVRNWQTDVVLIPNRRPNVGERVLAEINSLHYGHGHHGHHGSSSSSSSSSDSD